MIYMKKIVCIVFLNLFFSGVAWAQNHTIIEIPNMERAYVQDMSSKNMIKMLDLGEVKLPLKAQLSKKEQGYIFRHQGKSYLIRPSFVKTNQRHVVDACKTLPSDLPTTLANESTSKAVRGVGEVCAK
ncbi:hypothetical protein [uncultured Paenalcaligenes sp.]|uniref:hypothetical protein n=1 Tax=uncultured Paenalcaligenes sp. TaxID=1588925 RepID=UPI002633945A|nr:hypothetical protein [uncultured Paenalcaligenes sp.]